MLQHDYADLARIAAALERIAESLDRLVDPNSPHMRVLRGADPIRPVKRDKTT